MAGKFRVLLMPMIAMTACAMLGCFVDPSADEVSAEDERVMHAMVAISCKLGVEPVVISDRPALVPRQSDLHDANHRNVQFGIDLSQRPAREARWPRGKICPMVRVAGDTSITTVLSQDSTTWVHFIAAFDGADTLMRISLPVYSSDGKRAVIYTEGNCPYTCGAGFYHELEKTRSGWKIARSVNAWKS